MDNKKSNLGERKFAARRPVGAAKGGRIATLVREVVTPIADELGYVIWDIEYVKEGADHILRITIDSDDGITIDDCEKFTHAVDAPLDAADPIEGAYMLEISSPGIERNLSRPEHFLHCIGEKVEIKLFAPLDGNKVYVGILENYNDGEMVINISGESKTIPESAVAKARTLFDF